MAGVDALASYLINMLGNMAIEEVEMLIGVPSAIDDLARKLGDMKNVLADADRRTITEETVQGWVDELNRAMYDATDILDLCKLKAMEQGPSEDIGCLNPLLFCMRNPLHAHEIGNSIRKLNQKLDDISKRGDSFKFIRQEANQDPITRPPLVDRKTDPLLERSGVVGEKIEENTRVLVEMLIEELGNESDNISVVAIVGIGGIGKTTLSKNVFNDQVIQDKFTKKIWLSVTREFNEIELLTSAITQVSSGNQPESVGGSQDKSSLRPALANAIRDVKLFLVLDDMWVLDVWTNLLKDPFSHCARGSRVLITSRHEDVARGMRTTQPFFHIDKLHSEDAWSLLKKQIVTNEKSEWEVDMLKDIGLQIIAKCDGLPLAVKVMGGLLCQREKNRHDWEKVLNDAMSSATEMPIELNYAIYLSYKDLKPALKQCFLHFSLKPKKSKSNSVLDSEELVAMWISEGFVYGDSDKLEEIGSGYRKELISRNLIERDTDYIDDQYVCNMHDVVRSFAQYVTRGEALVAHDGENFESKLKSPSFLRLSIETKGVESEESEWRSLREQKSLRSIILSGNLKIQSSDSLVTFSSLRTLHVEFAIFAPLIASLHQLKHLRYLAVENCNDINNLPEDIHEMKFLQYISLEGCQNILKLPDSIVKLRELRYLKILGTHIDSVPSGFCALTNLRALYGFPACVDEGWCNLEELGPLSHLRCIHLVDLGDVSSAIFATKVRLGEKVHLTSMILECGGRLRDDGLTKEGVDEKDQEIIEKVFDELYPPANIEDIFIDEYFGCHLPRWMLSTATTSFKRLRTIKLLNLAYCTQLPDGLCLLQSLEYLEVHRAPAIKHVGFEFVKPQGHRRHPSSQVVAAFPRLHKMYLIGMVEWEERDWKEEVQAMPVLQELSIHSCKLKFIPPGLATHTRALKKIHLGEVQGLQSLENFASVVELTLYDLPKLTRISNFPGLQELTVTRCQKLKSLEEMSALRRLVLSVHYSKKQLPFYLQTIHPGHLLLKCSLMILISMALGESGSEWDKFSHIQHVEAYADDLDEDIENGWYLFYTSEPNSMKKNIPKELLESEEEEDVKGKGKNEEENMGHDCIVTL